MNSLKKKKILIILSWPFYDSLTMACQIPYCYMMKKYLAKDDEIYIHTEEKDKDLINTPDAINLRNKLKADNIFIVPQPYQKMGVKKLLNVPLNLIKLILFAIQKKIDIIFANGMTAGMLAYIVAQSSNKKLILDGCEPHADCMLETGTWKKNSLAYKVLKYFEKKQIKKAKIVLGSTNGLKDFCIKNYQTTIKEFYLRPSCVNLEKFKKNESESIHLKKELGFENSKVCIYVGKFGSQYLDIEIFEFFKECQNYWGNKFKVLILTPHTPQEIKDYCKCANLDFSIFTILFVLHDDVPKYMSVADFAINPVRPIAANRYCSPIKDGEYWAMGLPVVITKDISDDSEIIENENIGVVLHELNSNFYKIAIQKIENLLKEDKLILSEKIRNCAIKYRSYAIAENAYENVFKKY